MAPFYSPISLISQLRGQYWVNPLLSISFAIAIFSMAGIPPLVGFFAKQMVLSSAIQEGYMFVSIVAILASVISAAYYLRIVKFIFFENFSRKQKDETLNSEAGKFQESYHLNELNGKIQMVKYQYTLNYMHCFVISLSSMFILLFIINPTLILNSVHLLTLNLFFY